MHKPSGAATRGDGCANCWANEILGYRKGKNSQDEWQQFIAAHRDLLSATDLPVTLFRSESVFSTFLDTGQSSDPPLSLSSLPDDQFFALEAVINKWFFDGWHQKSLVALARHRLEKFGRYA